MKNLEAPTHGTVGKLFTTTGLFFLVLKLLESWITETVLSVDSVPFK